MKQNGKIGMSRQSFLSWMALLVLVDQTVKIITDIYFFDVHFEIIPSLFEFYPTFNNKHSFIYMLFDWNIGFLPHVIVYSTMEIIILLLYKYLRNTAKNPKWFDAAFVFQFSGWTSSILFDRIFWTQGTLDFIYLKPLFVFDLKDLYLTIFDVFACLLVLHYHKNRKEMKLNITFKTLYIEACNCLSYLNFYKYGKKNEFEN